VLSTTTKLFAGAIVLAACLVPGRLWAGVDSALPLVLSAATLGDDGRDGVAQADELLKAARKAMSEGNYEVADSKITAAEKLQPKYAPIHIGDTPKKARTDLDKLVAKRGAAGDANVKTKPARDRAAAQLPVDPFQARQSQPPAQMAAAGGRPPISAGSLDISDASIPAASQAMPSTPVVGIRTSAGAITESPVAGLQAPGGSGSRSIRSLAEPEGPNPWDIDGAPAAAASATASSPNQNIARGTGQARDAVAQNQNLARTQSDAMLLDARRILARGDARTAQMKVDQAKGLGVSYAPMDDSPAKVEALIRKFAALPAATAADSEGIRRRRAEIWMEEAEGLIRWREYNEAERLARDTQRLGINYSPFEPKPDQLLGRIAEARQTAGPTSGSHPLAAGSPDKQRAIDLARQARLAMAQGDLAAAEQMARQGESLAPDTVFGPSEDRPTLVLLDIQRAKAERYPVSRAGGATITDPSRYPVASAVYDPANDRTQNIAANSTSGFLPSLTEPTPDGGTGEAMRSYQLGMEAAARYNRDDALANFRRAYAFQMELDPQTRKSLYDELRKLGDPVDSSNTVGSPALTAASGSRQAWDRLPLRSTAPVSANYSPQSPAAAPGLISPGAIAAATTPPAAAAIPSPLENVPSPTPPTTSGQALARQVANEVARQQSLAREMREKQPKQALETLQRTRDMVANVSGLDPAARDQLLKRLDLTIADFQQYVAKNGPQIELDERNKKIEQGVDSSRKQKVVVQEKLAYLVNDFNKAVDEQRYADAQLLAKKATELDPENPVVVQLNVMSRALARAAQNDQIRSDAENGFQEVMDDVDEAKIPFKGPYKMPDAKTWSTLSKTRLARLRDGTQRRSPKEMEIAQRLNTPVDAKYQNRPLREVLDGLAKRASVPLYIDPQGLQSEGVSSDAKVTIDLSQDISLKSALNLILEQFHLTYVIKDEVLKVTSEDARRGEVYQVIYPVGDLVIPIPNFAPSGREGINGAFREAYERMGFSGAAGGPGLGGAGPITLATNEQGAGSSFAANAGVLAQMQQRPGFPIFGSGSTSTGAQQNIPFGPGGLKGGQQADFDSLIDLITSTIEQESWTDKGGQGSISPFNTNLSLVISQTQEVHEKIADLLQQLRRLQDLQVTIEVRFITLEDDFFEKMGMDFDFNIPTATTVPNPPPSNPSPGPPSFGPLRPSAVVGLQQNSQLTPLEDIQFRQNSFGVTPPFGGFDAGSAATFGFAVLSDIQAFFVIQAAQGDTRSNILQAPKVTLFNGQQASIADQTQVPFVTSVIPVVGDFAAALQPVIVVLSQGTSLTVQAVVSNDRRFVRLTVVPFFSQIGDVNTFTFNGSSSTTKKSSDSKSGDSDSSTSAEDDSSSTGTTVQLPQFSFVTVTTTVSVPDGGTVLLGGIKRLNEGRTERGIPILSKLPYINRLFRNTAIGRETTSLMMMVTPRIIIQEEEEQKLLGGAQP